jgi:hypothetical protein
LNIASQCHGASDIVRAVPAFLRDLLDQILRES